MRAIVPIAAEDRPLTHQPEKSKKLKIRRAARRTCFGATAARTHTCYALRCNGSAQAREPIFALSDSGTPSQDEQREPQLAPWPQMPPKSARLGT